MAEHKGISTIVRDYKKDGTLFWNEMAISPMFDGEGKLTHYLSIENDITERIETQNKLMHLSRLYEQISIISTKLINSKFEEIGSSIDDSLRILGD